MGEGVVRRWGVENRGYFCTWPAVGHLGFDCSGFSIYEGFHMGSHRAPAWQISRESQMCV